MQNHRFINLLILGTLLIGLPLLGAAIAGLPLSKYAIYPPTTEPAEHLAFSWPVFIGLAVFLACVFFPFEFRALRWRGSIANPPAISHFPRWGWAGIAFGICAWILAWNRFSWFEPFQRFTFSPLWFAYIIVINALTFRRKGRCMMTHHPKYFAALFLLSAIFWWFFEYLNRFVENWYYVGIFPITPSEYFVFATLPFATVLPAVLGTFDLLDSYPRIGAGLDHYIRIDLIYYKPAAWLTLLVFSLGLAAIGIWPDFLFPLLWLSPLFIICALQALQNRPTIFAPVREGQWRKIYLLAMASLICGCFWEMWNYHSLARWIYTVPFVGRFKIFEMPLLGYAGYLPFGVECAIIAEMITHKKGA